MAERRLRCVPVRVCTCDIGTVSSIYIYMEWDLPVTDWAKSEAKFGRYGCPELRRFQFTLTLYPRFLSKTKPKLVIAYLTPSPLSSVVAYKIPNYINNVRSFIRHLRDLILGKLLPCSKQKIKSQYIPLEMHDWYSRSRDWLESTGLYIWSEIFRSPSEAKRNSGPPCPSYLASLLAQSVTGRSHSIYIYMELTVRDQQRSN